MSMPNTSRLDSSGEDRSSRPASTWHTARGRAWAAGQTSRFIGSDRFSGEWNLPRSACRAARLTQQDAGQTPQRWRQSARGRPEDSSFHGVNAYPLARARRSGAVTLWEKVDSLTPSIARRGDMLLVQIAEAREIGMADFLDLDANRVL
jgi:hypothetical protein